jgi:hypothetical protein
MHEAPEQRMEMYLRRLRACLCGLGQREIDEIVGELRSHILDKAVTGRELTAAGVEDALAALGTPERLASEYMTQDLLARAEVTRSPLRIIDALLRWATLSLGGFFVLLLSVTGYFLAGVFLLCALLKPFHPHTAGLWFIPDTSGDLQISLRLGFVGAPATGHDVLGWWIVPIGLTIACALVVLTTRFALLCTRQYRCSRSLSPRLANRAGAGNV